MLTQDNRLDLYATLCSLFCYPDEDLVEQLETGQLSVIPEILPSASPPPDFEGSLDLSALQVSYTSLFINRLGGVPAPPYGSAYLDENRLMGTSTQQVEKLFAEGGLAVEGSSEPADYLPTELEFMFRLIESEEAALERDDAEAAQLFSTLQSRFVNTCLYPWVGEFSRRIQQDKESHPLYSWASQLLVDFCEAEHESLPATN